MSTQVIHKLDMSDTPRTDAVTNWDTERTLVAELCKELERELSALRKENEAIREAVRETLLQVIQIGG